jgi:hypothetical protein
MRRALLLLGLLGTALTLPGCVISLFSDNEIHAVDQEKLEELETRMDRVEWKGEEYGY